MARSGALVAALVVAAAAAIALASTPQVQAGFYFTDEDLASDESMWALYKRWAAHHDAVCDKTNRFPIFKKNARRIRHKPLNKNNGIFAINIFGDMTFDEVIAFATGEIDE